MEKTKAQIAVQAAQDSLEEANRMLSEATKALMECTSSEKEGQLERDVQVAKDEVEEAEQNLEKKLEQQQKILDHEQSRIRRAQQNNKTQAFVNVNLRARKANQLADYQSYKEQVKKEKEQAAVKPKFDPFQRRKAKPINLWYVGEDQDKDATNAEKDSLPTANDSQPQNQDDFTTNKLANNRDNDPRDELSMDIEEPFMALNGSTSRKRRRNRVRKGISLSDYLERKAAGTL